ncbi:MAG: right-handed parallel beta-helix repeat-containing protein, partial [Gaiellaceae bacterium]
MHGLTLTGRHDSLGVSASTFSADGLHVRDSAENGVVLDGGSQGTLDEPTIENSASIGVGMWNGGGTLQIHGGTIAHSAHTGVGCDSGEIVLDGTVVTGTGGLGVSAGGECYVGVQGGRIENSAGDGLCAFGGTIVVEFGTVIQGNGKAGARAQGGGNVGISDAVVRDNVEGGVFGWMGGHVAVGATTVENNHGTGIGLYGGSSAGIGSHTVIRGNAGNG